MTQMDPTYRPSLMDNNSNWSGVLPVAGSDLVLSPAQWSTHVVGMDIPLKPLLILKYVIFAICLILTLELFFGGFIFVSVAF